MEQAYIISAVRTPLGRFGGTLANFSPIDLGAKAMRAALETAGVSGELVDLYVFGNVLRSGHGQLLPRQAAFKAGIPETANGYAVDMVCSSGMIGVMNATLAIRSGEADIVLAGGMESMSQAGFSLSHRARWGYKFLLGAPEQLTDILLRDGLSDGTTGEGMGEQTERIAQIHGFARKDLDEIALNSHQRAAAATEKGIFKKEIVPIEVSTKKGTQIIDTDEGIRADTSLEALAKLRPAFNKDGVLTAGNSSQISDGAAALILASQSAVDKYGLKPIAKVIGSSWQGGETWRFVEIPVLAVKKLLDKLNLKISDFDLFENNEAFAVNSLLFHHLLGIPLERLNVNGGAIALGHPIGASGARILVTLLNALEQEDGQLGLAAICHGTGGGTAIAIERLK
ncbi:acetyl-CoA acetyltransferase PhaA [Chlorogloeopsis fritschii PCC 9212]|uniref:acetyl-CoA C-acetyltransferase n=1 Tax=Chlorogloeopsis fritschii PCC 6912 TaxID=211165 RepID=A0A3S0XH93_CHLFR|nr:acetyl-CoA acetyltransferase PhaA [Chlorogloeopsis fritschii]RUR72867.1 acetyl-CoA acetyltransferase [Chlorogloeopsis fritschii PCC 6912]